MDSGNLLNETRVNLFCMWAVGTCIPLHSKRKLKSISLALHSTQTVLIKVKFSASVQDVTPLVLMSLMKRHESVQLYAGLVVDVLEHNSSTPSLENAWREIAAQVRLNQYLYSEANTVKFFNIHLVFNKFLAIVHMFLTRSMCYSRLCNRL